MMITKLGKLSTGEALKYAEKYVIIRDHKRVGLNVTFQMGSHDNMFEISRALNERLNLLTDKELKDMGKELQLMIRTEQDEIKKNAISFLIGLTYQILRPQQESIYGN